MTHEGQVRRADLNLKSKYPEIETVIYKIDENSYCIHCDQTPNGIVELKREFHNSIATLGTRADLSENIPDKYELIIPCIKDDEIAKNFEGIVMTKIDLLNVLIGKFPKVLFYKIEDNFKKVVIRTHVFKEKSNNRIHLSFLSNVDRLKIEEFILGLKMSFEFEIIEDELESPQELKGYLVHNPVQYIYSNGFWRYRMPEFSDRDETLWFENIDKIFKGDYKKEDLYFFNEKEYSCYVDYSIFENIDIRNLLFLFETLYITLPFEKSITQWLIQKKIRAEEFLELIKKNRIKVVLTQPELRYYDSGFFQEIYKTNPNAIITRRAIIALQQIDIIDLADNYIFNDIKVIKEMGEFCNILEGAAKINAKFMYDILLWPIKAKRNSFQSLHYSGMMGIPSFGVNTALEKGISDVTNMDLSFEFHVCASSIHLANALNAIYFPFIAKDGYSDHHFTNIMGELLNFYKNATTSTIKSFLESRQQGSSGILPINPIDIIEINDYVSITELEKVLSKETIYPNSKRLIEFLGGLSPEKRQKKIEEYNIEVQKKLYGLGKHDGVLDLGKNILMDTTDTITGFSALGSAISFLKLGGKKLSNAIPKLKNISAKIEESLYNDDVDKANIHYLTRINRVARIKRD